MLTQEGQDPADLFRRDRLGFLRLKRGRQKMDPRRVVLDVGGQETGIHAPEVLGEIHKVESGMGAEHHGALAQLEIQVHQQRLALGAAVDEDGEIGRQGGRAAATFEAEERQDLARLALLVAIMLAELVCAASGRSAKIVRVYRLGEVVRHPGPHGLHQLIAGENRSGGYEQLRRVELHQVLGQLETEVRAVTQIQNDQLGSHPPQGLDLVLAELVQRHADLEIQRHRTVGPGQQLLDLGHERGVAGDKRSARKSGIAHQAAQFYSMSSSVLTRGPVSAPGLQSPRRVRGTDPSSRPCSCPVDRYTPAFL